MVDEKGLNIKRVKSAGEIESPLEPGDGAVDECAGLVHSKLENQLQNSTVDLDKVIRIYDQLSRAFVPDYEVFLGTRRYTDLDADLGEGDVYNSLQVSRQLLFTLALSDNAIVRGILDEINGARIDSRKADSYIGEMVKAKVLSGMKIIDLGCGPYPTFARIARRMGAEVYTVDVKSLFDTTLDYPIPDSDLADAEKRNHMQLDLTSPGVADSIKGRSRVSEFDLVTHAHLDTGDVGVSSPRGIEIVRLAKSLLRENGVFVDPAGYVLRAAYISPQEGKSTSELLVKK